MFIFTIDQDLWTRKLMSCIMSCDHSLGRSERIYLNLFYCFMILFQCNSVIILSLIIFCLNCNQHVIDTRHFKILQYHVRLSTIYLYFYDPLQVINFNSLNMQICHIMSCHVIFLHWKIFLKIQGACYITLCYIIFLYWKIIQKINKITSWHITFLNCKIILKIQVTCHVTSCHINFLYWKIILNIKKSLHIISPFSIEKQF
jgi:hypothetical protein